IAERIEGLFRRVTVGAPLHAVVFERREIRRAARKGDGQATRWAELSEERLGDGLATFASWLPRGEDSAGALVGEAEVDGAPGDHNKNDWLSQSHDLLEQALLKPREFEAQLVATGFRVSDVPLLAFDFRR